MDGLKPIKFKQANKNLQKPNNMTDEECKAYGYIRTDKFVYPVGK